MHSNTNIKQDIVQQQTKIIEELREETLVQEEYHNLKAAVMFNLSNWIRAC